MRTLEIIQDITGLMLILLIVTPVMLGYLCYNVCSTFED